jgi:Flp pilus assembly protein TadG
MRFKILPKFLRLGLGRRAIAAVEFAIVAPILLVLVIGTIEVLTLYRTEAKLNALAINIGQMVSDAQAVAATTTAATTTTNYTALTDACQGAVAGLAPYPAGGMNVSVVSLTLETTGPTYDYWEGDSTAAAQGCTSGGTAIGQAAATALVGSSTTGMLQTPCDNIIIVRASITYPGLTGLVLRARPVLTQTAYTRWAFTSTTSELLCPSCTVVNVSKPVCK